MYGKYKDVVLNNFSGGLNTRFDADQLEDNESPDLQNVQFNSRNSFGPRQGNSIFGTSVVSGAAITNTYGFNDRKGNSHALRTYTSALEYYNSTTESWEILRNDFSPGLKFGFAYFGSASLDDFLYINNGIDTRWAWHPRFGQVSGAVSASNTVVYLSTSYALSALGWLSAGSAIVNGDEFYYGSLSGNALSACVRASGASNWTTQSPVAQLPISSYAFSYKGAGSTTYKLSGMPKGNVMNTFQSRIGVVGASAIGEVLQYSMIDNPWDFKYNSTLSAGDGGVFSFSEGGGQIKGLAGKDDTWIVLKEDVVRGLTFNDNDFPIPKTIIDGLNLGAVNSKAVVGVESDIYFVSPIGMVRSLSRNDSNGTFDLKQIAGKIEPTLQSLDLTSVAATYYNNKFYIACATSGASYNNTVLTYDYVYNGWSKYVGWNVTDWFIYNKELYYGSSNEHATYLVNDGYDDNEYGYEVYYNTKELNYGTPHELKRCRFVYVEGFMTTNSEIDVDLYYNNDSSPITKTISGTGSYVDLTDPTPVFGRSTFGKGTYGGTNSNQTYILYPFKVRLSYDNVDFFKMKLKFSSDQPGYVWKITNIVPYVEGLDGKKFPVDNII